MFLIPKMQNYALCFLALISKLYATADILVFFFTYFKGLANTHVWYILFVEEGEEEMEEYAFAQYPFGRISR